MKREQGFERLGADRSWHAQIDPGTSRKAGQIDFDANEKERVLAASMRVCVSSDQLLPAPDCPKTKLSGRKICPKGPARTESMVPGSRSIRIARGT